MNQLIINNFPPELSSLLYEIKHNNGQKKIYNLVGSGSNGKTSIIRSLKQLYANDYVVLFGCLLEGKKKYSLSYELLNTNKKIIIFTDLITHVFISRDILNILKNSNKIIIFESNNQMIKNTDHDLVNIITFTNIFCNNPIGHLQKNQINNFDANNLLNNAINLL